MIRLTPKTKKGKNIIRRDGLEWGIHTIQPNILFDTRPGPWARIHPMQHEHHNAESRWIHLTDDTDFEVSMIELLSVGTALCPKTFNTFALDADGAPDLDNPVHLEDVVESWLSALDTEEFQLIANLKYSKKFQPIAK